MCFAGGGGCYNIVQDTTAPVDAIAAPGGDLPFMCTWSSSSDLRLSCPHSTPPCGIDDSQQGVLLRPPPRKYNSRNAAGLLSLSRRPTFGVDQNLAQQCVLFMLQKLHRCLLVAARYCTWLRCSHRRQLILLFTWLVRFRPAPTRRQTEETPIEPASISRPKYYWTSALQVRRYCIQKEFSVIRSVAGSRQFPYCRKF